MTKHQQINIRVTGRKSAGKRGLLGGASTSVGAPRPSVAPRQAN